jgi:uncharacterized protein (DUF927 family)
MEYSLPELNDICQMNKEDILKEELFLAFFEIKDSVERARYEIELKDRAKQLKAGPAFNKLFSEYSKQAQEINKAQHSDIEIKTEYGNYNCAGWSISEETGIKTYSIFGAEVIACYHIIIPIKRFINIETQEEMVTLAYKRSGDDDWRQVVVKRDIIANASKITALAGKGVAVTSETAKALVRFLSDFENANYSSISTKKSTSRLGWHNGFFVPVEGKDIVFDGEAKFKSAYEALDPNGEYEDWIDYVKELRNRGRFDINVYLAASFASVLINSVGALPFILNLYGPSGRGKTVALMMACSVWANPKEGEYISGANSTVTAIEQKLNFLNHLPLMLDDMATLKKKPDEDFSDFIYRVCAGQGRTRSNVSLTIDPLTNWKNATLTNSERPITSGITNGGAINRVLDIPIDQGTMFEDGNEAAGFFKANYGHAGVDFIKILHMYGRQKIQEIFSGKRKQLIDIMKAKEDTKEEKQLIPMALILAADQVITDEIFKDGNYLDVEKAYSVLKGQNEVSENEQAWEYLLDIIEINKGLFSKKESDGEYMPHKWGKLEVDDISKAEYACIIKTVFDRELRNGGYDPAIFLKWCIENKGVIARIGKRGGAQGTSIRDGKDCFKGIKIPIKAATIEVDEKGFIKVEDTEDELPFKT